MLLKGLVKVLTVILIIFSLYRLSFTFVANNIEKKLKAKAESSVAKSNPSATVGERNEMADAVYLKMADSMRGEKVIDFLGAKFTYQDVKEKELQLGLDLQGGMSVTMEVGLDEMVRNMAINPTNPILVKAIDAANAKKANTDADFITLFSNTIQQQNPNFKLAQLFSKPSQTVIKASSSNEEVIAAIRTEAKAAFNRTFNVISNRVDRFGLSQPSINKNPDKGTINVELAGVRDPESLRNTLQAAAKLQFWEVAGNQELAQSLNKAHEASVAFLKGDKPSVTVSDTGKTLAKNDSATQKTDTNQASLSALTGNDTGAALPGAANDAKTPDKGLFTYMNPVISKDGQYMDASIIGIVEKKNADKVMELLNTDVIKSQFPANIRFLFGEVPGSSLDKNDPKAALGVYAIKMLPGRATAKVEGDMVKSAKFDYQPGTNRPEIRLEMNQQGTIAWANLTGANVGKPIAIALDDYVYSAPNVIEKMSNGTSSITGSFDAKSGTDLANILETGKLDAPARIVQEQIVGSTLGQESIDGGIISFIISFAIIFILMVVYYNTGGIVANIALILNLLFTFGILANLGATLTMPGIAGLVLGIGMAVDVNVIIFERIKEELASGKTYEQAVRDGYVRSYAPVLDSHVTGLITAVILLYFGYGPIRGFATTQIISLILSLFTGIFVSRLVTDMYMKRGRHFKYFTGLSKTIFRKAHFKFIQARKYTYFISGALVILGALSFVNGFDYGVEFDGGRSYNVRFDKELKTVDVREKLQNYFGGKRPIVKTIGSNNEMNITTDYLINETGKNTDDKVLNSLYTGLKTEGLIPAGVSYQTFSGPSYIQKSDKVLPSISDDLKRGAIYATVFAMLAIFIYILARFRKWQYSVGTILSLLHDTAIMLALFSFARYIVPFSLEIDQHFIAALLTVIGFSMNDTVIVFDRIREYFRKTPNGNKTEIINAAINDTLSRTIMTSVTVFITVLVLFLVGGEVLRGFSFAMLIGVVAGTYSSIFVAAPVLVDLDKGNTLSVEEDKEERIRVLKTQA